MRSPIRVLIVEDDTEQVLSVIRDLKRGGYEPRSLCVGDHDGLISALDGEWDLLLCGLDLSAMAASTVLSEVRDRCPDLPVIVLSGDVDEDVMINMVRQGASDIVTRRNPARLIPAVRRAVSESAAVRARVQAEDALEQSESRYRSLFMNLPVGVFRIGAGGSVLSANPAFRDMFGLRDSYEVMRSRIDEFVLDETQVPEIRRRIFKGPQRNEFDVHLRRQGGGPFWAHVFFSAARDKNGQVVHVEGIIQDINERKVLETALLRGKREWESTFDTVRELLMLVDLDGRIVRCNRAVARRMKADVRALPGRSCLEILVGEGDERRRRTLLDMIRSGVSHDVDVSSEVLDGDFRFSLSARTEGDGRVVGATLVGRDMTLAHQEEQLERLRGTIDQAERIFQTLRHELGNTLNTLKTTLSVFRMKFDDFDARQKSTYFERCSATLGIAERLLQSLRSYQTFDRLNIEMLRLGDFLDRRLDLAFENARAKKVVCAKDLCSEDLYIRADADALVRIIVNLVDNAIAGLAGRPDPAITVKCAAGQGSAVLEVTDNGCGISEDELPFVFDPLFTTRAEGSGMGLAIVQKLMVNMGGVAEIRSREGSGTTVVLRFPRIDPPDSEMVDGP